MLQPGLRAMDFTAEQMAECWRTMYDALTLIASPSAGSASDRRAIARRALDRLAAPLIETQREWK